MEGPLIQSVSFRGDGMVEIQYSEDHDHSDHVALIKVLMFDAKLVEEQIEELVSDITDLIDIAMDKLRNPPMTRPARG